MLKRSVPTKGVKSILVGKKANSTLSTELHHNKNETETILEKNNLRRKRTYISFPLKPKVENSKKRQDETKHDSNAIA